MVKKKILIPLYNYFIGNGKHRKRIRKKYHMDGRKRNIVVIGTPHHGNLGDYAIFLAEAQFLTDCFPDANLMEINLADWKNEKGLLQKLLRRRDLIILTGGGNMGNVYMEDENTRREAISMFPHNVIVLFPQTMFFTPDEDGKRQLDISVGQYGKHKRLFLVARDEVSYNTMKEAFVNPVMLLPDVVLMYRPEIEPYKERKGALMVLRSDAEGRLSRENRQSIYKLLMEKTGEVEETDTEIFGKFPLSVLKEETLNKIRQFTGARIVVTDRLHGMIFAAITGTPCVVLSNYNHKVKECYKWISNLQYIRYAEDDRIEEAVDELMELNVEELVYDNKEIKERYQELKREILHVS